jgi:dihydropteroate synthase
LATIGKTVIGGSAPVRIMGIINVSPESFYKKSVKRSSSKIVDAAAEMYKTGAEIIDIGAMSTAPYLETIISVEKEARRMRHAIGLIRGNCPLSISVDTPRSEVAREAIKLGVDAINDISGLKYDKNMAQVVANSGLPVIIGAYGGNSGKSTPVSGDIMGTMELLNESISIANRAGIASENIIVDPSVGFFRVKGKNPFYTKMIDLPWYVRDIEVISNLKRLKTLSKPICVCVSRKSFIGNLFKLQTRERLIPSVVAEIVCMLHGANLIRTHDVKDTRRTLIMLQLLD